MASFDINPSLGLEVVYVLVRQPFTIKSMEGRCLELGRVGSLIPFCYVGSDYPHVLKTASLARSSRSCSNLLILLEWLLPFSELSTFSDEDLGGSELEYFSLSVFAKDELFPSFFFPWIFWKESRPLVSFSP